MLVSAPANIAAYFETPPTLKPLNQLIEKILFFYTHEETSSNAELEW